MRNLKWKTKTSCMLVKREMNIRDKLDLNNTVEEIKQKVLYC